MGRGDLNCSSYFVLVPNQDMTPFVEAPELCIEILSASNTHAEMDEKKELSRTGYLPRPERFKTRNTVRRYNK